MIVVKALFWGSVGALAWTHAGYPLAAAVAARLRPRRVQARDELPRVAAVVAAHNEETVIERRLENLVGQDYPADRLEIVVASDASTDRTDELVDEVATREPRIRLLRCERGGKVAAQNRAVRETDAEILAFTDAATEWAPDALRKLVRSFADPDVAYVTGGHVYRAADGTNREGTYWKYEHWLRRNESRLGSITGGIGPIYAVRREDYVDVDPRFGHDLAFPYLMVQHGKRAVYDPEAARLREAFARPGGRVQAQGADARALLADHLERRDAASPRAGVRGRDRLAQAPSVRKRRPASDRSWNERRARPRGRRLPGDARRPARAARRCGGAEGDRPLLRAGDVGDGRRARELPAPGSAGDVGAARRHPVRRAFDVASSGSLLVLASPFLLGSAVAIKLDDGGPVLYRQRRVGKDGVEFELLKLRTMVVGAEKLGAGYAVDEGDPRITRAGRVLRRLSLDELPQLWNVLRGDMSLIGPRPTLAYQVERYTPRQRRRLEVKPGITGWAQVHGRAKLPWDERIELDVWYVEHRSFWLDLKILAKTPFALFGGTYKGATGGWKEKAP